MLGVEGDMVMMAVRSDGVLGEPGARRTRQHWAAEACPSPQECRRCGER